MVNVVWVGVCREHITYEAPEASEMVKRMEDGELITMLTGGHLQCIKHEGNTIGFGQIIERDIEKFDFGSDEFQPALQRVSVELLRYGLYGTVYVSHQEIDETETYLRH